MANFAPKFRFSTRSMALVWCGVGMVAIAIVGVAWGLSWRGRQDQAASIAAKQPEPASLPTQVTVPPLVKVGPPSTEGGLGLTVVEFQRQFDARAEENGLNYRLGSADVHDDKEHPGQKVFSAYLSKRAAITGWFSATDLSLRHVILMHQLVEPGEIVPIVKTFFSVADAIRPNEDHTPVFKALGLHDKKWKMTEEGKDVNKDGVTYHLSFNSVLGFVFSMEPVSAKLAGH